MAKVGDSPILFGRSDPQDAYELREARSEISRHHALIVELREALATTLMWAEDGPNDPALMDQYHKLLYRQVS